MSINRRQHGLTLIELIMFIVIVGVALAGVLTVLNHTTRHSADPLIRKQALAIAEAVLEEVMLQPFTFCDPDDPDAATAVDTGTCTVPEGIGVESVAGNTDTRLSNTSPFDNVSDYHGLDLPMPLNIAGGGSGPAYRTQVAVEAVDLNGISGGAALRVTVTVEAPGETIQLQGYRTRHSPNMLP